MRLSGPLQTFYERFLSLSGDPRVIAAGMALGVFVGVTPTIPFHTAIILALGLPFRQNITAAYLGSWIISNPLTIPLFYVAEYQLGRRMLGLETPPLIFTDFSWRGIAGLGSEVLLPLLLGGLVMAPFFTVIAYVLTRRLVIALRQGRER